jgi:hypothetical protein
MLHNVCSIFLSTMGCSSVLFVNKVMHCDTLNNAPLSAYVHIGSRDLWLKFLKLVLMRYETEFCSHTK